MTLRFSHHGISIAVEGQKALTDAIGFDFAAFPRADTSADVTLALHKKPPPFRKAPATARVVRVQPNCVVFAESTGRVWVDYQGKALSTWDPSTERAEMWSEDGDLLHELGYLFVLSRLGELLDRRGLHRLHAFAVSIKGKAIILLLPSGGGKTTLGLSLLDRKDTALLSDDTPLIATDGTVYAFPSRLGTLSPQKRKLNRRDRPPKYLADARSYRRADQAEPYALIFGERQLQGPASLQSLSRVTAAPELFRSGVVGLGLPQIVEYFLRADAKDLARKVPLTLGRTRAMAALLARSRAYTLRLSRDAAENLRALRPILEGA